MRRFLRIAFNALTVLSLVLAVGATVFWPRSFRYAEFALQHGPLGSVALGSGFGVLGFYVLSTWDPSVKPSVEFESAKADSHQKQEWSKAWDFGFNRRPNRIVVTAPHWFVICIAGALPVLRVVASRRLKALRETTDRCSICNYDLRATPDRCPECGAVPKGASV